MQQGIQVLEFRLRVTMLPSWDWEQITIYILWVCFHFTSTFNPCFSFECHWIWPTWKNTTFLLGPSVKTTAVMHLVWDTKIHLVFRRSFCLTVMYRFGEERPFQRAAGLKNTVLYSSVAFDLDKPEVMILATCKSLKRNLISGCTWEFSSDVIKKLFSLWEIHLMLRHVRGANEKFDDKVLIRWNMQKKSAVGLDEDLEHAQLCGCQPFCQKAIGIRITFPFNFDARGYCCVG